MVVMLVQENLLVLVMCVQVKLLVLVMLVQVIPLVLSMFLQQSPLVLVIFVQVSLFVETMFAQVKSICRSNFRQSEPTNVNILPCKPFLTDHIYHVNSSTILSRQLFFVFFLSILIFSVYFKFRIITNMFTNLLLAIVMLLSKITCLKFLTVKMCVP